MSTTTTEADETVESEELDRQQKLEDWSRHFGDTDPYELDDSEKRDPSDIRPVDYERDEHGSYNPAAGVTDRQAALDAGRCGAQLEHSLERYGEPRYCTRIPVASFSDGGSPRCHDHCD